jgi:hypothetical protein
MSALSTLKLHLLGLLAAALLAVPVFAQTAEPTDSLLQADTDTAQVLLLHPLNIDTLTRAAIDTAGKASRIAELQNFTPPTEDFSFKEASLKQRKKMEKEEEKILDLEMIHARRATFWGIIPGGGQIYNRRWWKLPIVYGVLGAAGWFVVNSATEMKRYNTALDLRLENLPDEFFGILSDQQVVANRNFYRRNLQLGAVGFTALWGLSIIDAVVDAHMKTYDISDNLGLKFKPGVLTVANKSVPSLRITLLL